MEGDKLYSIKWYRNGHEFYRYIPSDNPSTTIFNGNGINVDKSQSSEEEILLRSVDLDTTGMYRCEISGEAPLFQTASREAVLAVVGKFFFWLSTGFLRRQIMERKLFFSLLLIPSKLEAFTWLLRWWLSVERKNQLINDGDFLFCFQIYRTKVLSLPEASRAITLGIKWRSIARRKKANPLQN